MPAPKKNPAVIAAAIALRVAKAAKAAKAAKVITKKPVIKVQPKPNLKANPKSNVKVIRGPLTAKQTEAKRISRANVRTYNRMGL